MSPRIEGERLPSHRPVVSPNTRDFIEQVMKPLAERLRAGEDRRQIGDELFEHVYPWVLQQIRQETARMPMGADPDEIRSRMLEAAHRMAMDYDPECPQSWPAGLMARLKGAWMDAYRSVDFISRKHRALHNQFRSEVEIRTNTMKRELTKEEKIALAREILPESSHTDWADVVINKTPPPPMGGNAVEWEQVAHQIDYGVDPADTVGDVDCEERIKAWVETIKEPKLQQEVLRALETGKPLSARAKRGIVRYLPSLTMAIEVRGELLQQFAV